jgi:hypothetical protein
MTKSQARANDEYADGWVWDFLITVWDMSEVNLKMKFSEWSGAGTLAAGGNMQFSVDGTTWIDIEVDDTYSSVAVDISSIDDSGDLGRQVPIQVRMKVPVGTLAGIYNSGYGILTEL